MSYTLPKVLLIGYGGHGKDTVASMMKSWGFKVRGSSEWANEKLVFPQLQTQYGYADSKACYEDRRNHREEWFSILAAYNSPDPSALARGILAEADVFNGMRRYEELAACAKAGLFDLIIWVDRSGFEPPESVDSCTVSRNHADVILDNNGSKDELQQKVDRLCRILCAIKK